jgi:hypothetical protein
MTWITFHRNRVLLDGFASEPTGYLDRFGRPRRRFQEQCGSKS